MTTNKKKTSASDVLRQEMQQPLVIPTRVNTTAPSPSPTPTTTTHMTPPTNDDAQAKAAQEKEAKLQQQKFDDLTKQLNDAKAMIVKLSEQPAATPAKAKATTAIVKKDTSHASLTARPTQSREETLRRRNNTDIGWLD
jgi:septal ring factor EnvC (AmiA/AmiB activator)